jgi:hypothetical protein
MKKYEYEDDNCIFNDTIKCDKINCHDCEYYKKATSSRRLESFKGEQISIWEEEKKQMS